MKQLISALLVFALLLQPLFGQTTIQTPAKSSSEAPTEIVPIEDLLPADTLAYIASTNLAGLLHSFQLLDVYKVAQSRLPKEESESGDNPLSVVTKFLSFGIGNSRALEDTRIGLSLILPEMPPETEAEKNASAESQQSERRQPNPIILVFVEGSRIEDARQAREQFLAYYNETFEPIGKLSEIKQSNYKGVKVDRFKTGDIGLWFGATYVLSQPAAIDRLLNLREDRRAERLADNQDFIRTKTQMMPQTGIFAYLNGKPLTRLVETSLGRGGDFSMGGMSSIMSTMLGAASVKSAALATTFDREGVVDRLQINFDPAKKNILATLFSGPKNEFKAAQYIPAGTEILISHSLDWTKIYDDLYVSMMYGSAAYQELMQQYYAELETKRKEAVANKQKPPEMDWSAINQRIKSELTEERVQKKIKEREEEVNKELGFVLRDEAAKDLANEVTVAWGIPKTLAATLAKNDDEKPKDAEGWAVFVGIKDRVATQQALIKAFAYVMGGMGNSRDDDKDENQKIKPVKTEEQLKQERELRTKNAQSAWAMMPTEIYKKVEIKSVFAAHLAFSDEYLIVADSKETIKQMLDLSEGGRAIATDFNYSRAMSSLGGAGLTKVFVGPKMFDDTLNGFIKSWVTNPSTLDPDLSQRAPLNVPATAAAGIESENNSLKLELFSPLGIAGTVALWGFGSDVKQTTDRKENQARQNLWELRKAQKVYAQKHKNQYATLEVLAKAKVTAFDVETLKSEEGNYKFAFTLKPGGKGYEATATPIKYGRQGRKSFFIDESDKLRVADKQGAVATANDEVIEERVFGEEDDKPDVPLPPPPPAKRKK
ncbi:MAG: hypothetical protein JST84_15765 [Acidobacteria bacterium]|nr:hypothetical protein [Acidobacteriota bacterium]